MKMNEIMKLHCIVIIILQFMLFEKQIGNAFNRSVNSLFKQVGNGQLTANVDINNMYTPLYSTVGLPFFLLKFGLIYKMVQR